MRVTEIPTKKAKHAGKFGMLVLEDGTVFEGEGFGYPIAVYGEAVFNTGMVGYTEALTDPSYNGQILTLTYPLVGNYGVPDTNTRDSDGIRKYFESDKIQARGLVVHELSLTASHWNIAMTLDEWLYSEKIPGLSGIDTRALTTRLRTSGVMMAALQVSDEKIDANDLKRRLSEAKKYGDEEFMGDVSVKEPVTYGSGEESVVVVDTGVKNAILRNIRRLGYKVIRVPWNYPIQKILAYNPKGVVISNGPGDPIKCAKTMETARELLEKNVPTLGICLGAQILGLAGGASTYKLKYGHRGQNKSCIDLDNNRVYVTSQNHGYCIDPNSLEKTDFKLWFSNTDDNTVEGIRHKGKKVIAVQFHPEASPGPFDCMFIFEELKRLIGEENAKR